MPYPPLRHLLDPRPQSEARERPIADSVNIPLPELPSRTHELPSRGKAVQVAGPEPEAATEALAATGREALPAIEWRYGESGPGRLWEPNPFLIEALADRQPGEALDLACGSGRDAVALAGLGWRVSAVDHLPDALDKGRDLARRYLAPGEAARIEWIVRDLEAGPFPENRRFDLVSFFWYLHRPLVEQCRRLLRPGGILVAETFTAVHRETFGRPRTESFVLQPGELPELAGLEVLFTEEDWHDGRHSARLIAKARHSD